MNNDIGSIITYRGKKPEFMNFQEAQAQAQYNYGLYQQQNVMPQIGGLSSVHLYQEKKIKKENFSMFKSISDDMKSFMKENKSIIYWLAIFLVLDHYFFEDAFREKLKAMIHKLIGKVENQLDVKS